MTLSCNCDMPLPIYADWLQDQGWDCDELRAEEEPVLTYSGDGNGYGNGYGYGDGYGYGYGNWYGNGNGYGNGYGYGFGYGPTTRGNAT